ncbi:MAG: putative ABC transporter permease [Lachnospiraceae bacterium]|nr:putative ABC transporter permease [Lachnospiraceae bacterium]
MYVFVLLVFIFNIGAISGWVLEVIYRHLADEKKRWFNPGFCVGPYLPIYGIGLLAVYLITFLEDYIAVDNDIYKKVLLFLLMAICMTIIELVAGIVLLKFFDLRLWDYTDEKYNFKGFICLKFSLAWMILSALYYFFIHPIIYERVEWLSNNLIFSFFVGLVFGVFLVDVIYSANVVSRLRKYANEKGIIIKLEEIKERVIREKNKNDAKATFFVFMLKENLSKVLPLNKNQG